MDIVTRETLTDYEPAKSPPAAVASTLVVDPQIYRYYMASLEGSVSHIKLFQKVRI